MRISDWSSDVCSSDLAADQALLGLALQCVGVVAVALQGLVVHASGVESDRGDLVRHACRCRQPTTERLAGQDDVVAERTLGLIRERDGLIVLRSEEHTSELQSLMRISYAVFCLKKKKHTR